MVMTLEECLSYAKEHSITLKQASIAVEDYMIDESSAKATFLPTISGSARQGLTNSPFYEGNSEKTSYSGSYGVDLSMTLYNGGANSLSLKRSKIYTEIAQLALEQADDDIEVAITRTYIEILYSIDEIAVAKNSLELSQKNIERGSAMVEVGSMNEADYAQLLTAEATARYEIVSAQTTLRNKYVVLKHLLEISDGAELAVDPSSLPEDLVLADIPSIEDVYGVAVDNRPEIISSTLDIKTALINEKIAKSGYLPTLKLTAGIGFDHSAPSDYTFSSQFNNNYSNTLGLSLSVPIFNNLQNKNAVRKSKNATKIANLQLAESSKNLYTTIEALHTNATNSYAMYIVSKSKLQALETSLKLITEQFNVGAKDIIDLLTEQDDYRTSSQEYLESKYTLILNKALLEYYKTGIIKL